ncbi:MAG: hypothetical protein K8R35_08415, partial [Bacteroidales bacterium]|nr:hypothetical protein [Bacteroidales bacterium]
MIIIYILVKPVIHLLLTSTGLFTGVNSLPAQAVHLILTIIGLSAIIITLAVFFIARNRSYNKKLVQKNSEIEDANSRLENL